MWKVYLNCHMICHVFHWVYNIFKILCNNNKISDNNSNNYINHINSFKKKLDIGFLSYNQGRFRVTWLCEFEPLSGNTTLCDKVCQWLVFSGYFWLLSCTCNNYIISIQRNQCTKLQCFSTNMCSSSISSYLLVYKIFLFLMFNIVNSILYLLKLYSFEI